MIVAIGLATALSLAPVRADAAAQLGVACARAKAKAVDRATAGLIKCAGSGGGFGTVNPPCVERVRARMAQEFERAERLGCYGSQDDFPQMSNFVESFVSDLVQYLVPPGGCHRDGDGLTCGGLCDAGSTCLAAGDDCRCYPDELVCNATAAQPVLCPKIGQTCDDRTCVDPSAGYCREAPEGSGHATGFCPSDSTCLALPMGGRTVAACLPHLYGCEDPAGTCATSGAVFGFCTDVGRTCGPDCLCH